MRDATSPHYPRIYSRILLTYARRPGFWVWTPVILAMSLFVSSPLAVNLLLKGTRPDADLLAEQLVISAVFLTLVCVHFSTFVAGHAAKLLDLPHNHTVPHLRGPALIVAIALTLLGVLLPPLLWPRPLLLTGGRSTSLCAGAIAAVVAAEFAWMQCWPKLMHLGLLPTLAGGLPWLAFMRPDVRRIFFEMLQGWHPSLAVALYVAAALLFAALWFRLFRRRQLTAAGPLRLWPKRASALPAVPWSPRPAPATTFGRRLRLRTFLTAAGARDGLFGGIGGLIFALGVLLLQYLFGPGDPGASLVLSLVISVVVPLLAAARAGEARPALLTIELMLPPAPRDVGRDLGLALLVNLYAAWTAAQVAVLATFAVLAPDDLRTFAGAFALVLTISAAYQLFFFGVLAWFLSFRPTWLNGSLFFTLALIVVPLFARAFHRPEFASISGAAVATALALALTGVILTLTALRRWTIAEVRI